MSGFHSDFRLLLSKARCGDNDAMDKLVQEYESELMKFVQARLGNALRPYLDSVDLIQSVHKSVLIGIRDDKFDLQSPDHLIRLAAVIVRRKISRHWKRNRRQMRLDNEPTEICDGQSLASLVLSVSRPSIDPMHEVELNDRVKRVMDVLEPIDRRLIELRLEGCSTAEAARQLGLDSDFLRARLGRVRRKLVSCGIAADWF